MWIGCGRTSLYHYGELSVRLKCALDEQIVQQRHLRCDLSLRLRARVGRSVMLLCSLVVVLGVCVRVLNAPGHHAERADRLGRQGRRSGL